MPDVAASRRPVHLLQAGGARLALGLFRLLSPDASSAAGSRLLRTAGPAMRAHAVAERNLRRIFPDAEDAWIAGVLKGMWDNLGRTLGELPHIARIMDDPGRVEVTGVEHLARLRDDGRAGILFSAHLGNWELSPIVAARNGMPLHVFFRAPNNPLVHDLYETIRSNAQGELLPKGREGARRAMELLRKGEHVGMLVDQKMNDGIPVPFFGRDAMTAPALGQMALKFDIPVVPARVVRKGGAYFQVIIEPPLEVVRSGNTHDDVRTLMHMVNRRIEDWIRAAPEQWLWVHRRWTD